MTVLRSGPGGRSPACRIRSAMMPPLSAPALRRSREGAPPGAAGALSRNAWIAVAIVMTVLWFALLGTRALQHPDEGRYAEIGREMLATGDWTTPRLNGLKYFEKPALQYWVTAASFAAFGVNAWAARLPVALSGWLAVIAVGYAGLRLAGPTVGAYAGVALAGTVWHFGMAHVVTLDAMLSFWLTVALCAFLVAQRAAALPAERRMFMLVAWAAMAGALLTKGLVGLLIPGAALVAYTVATRDVALWRRLEILRGTALLLVLAVPWFVVVSTRNPEFAHFFFIHEHVERFLTTEHRRDGPWWYFVPLLVVGLLPWVGVFAVAAVRGWRDAPREANGFSWPRFCLVWIAFVFLFFSASGSKLPSYILPLFPAAGLLVGWQLAVIDRRLLLRLALPLAVGAWLLLAGAVAFSGALIAHLASPATPAAIFAALEPYVVAALAVAALGYTLAVVAFRRDGEARRTWGVIGVSLATMAMLQLLLAGNDAFRVTRSAVDAVRVLRSEAQPPFDPAAPVFQVGIYDQTLPFYLGRPTTLVAFRDEFALGIDAEPQKAIPHLGDWLAQWAGLAQGYALVGHDTLDQMTAHGATFRVVMRDARRALIARR